MHIKVCVSYAVQGTSIEVVEGNRLTRVSRIEEQTEEPYKLLDEIILLQKEMHSSAPNDPLPNLGTSVYNVFHFC
jgi:hypothetical protein